MSVGVQIVLVGIGTYLIRVSAIAAVGRFGEPSPSTVATMRLIAPAVLAAIVADRLVLDDGAFVVRWSWWVGAGLAAFVAYRWRSAGLTMVIGIGTVWAFDLLAS
ncbi:MAG: AzlD domain-containing protein [Actinomycetota bacterium]